MVDQREQIQVNGQMIARTAFVATYEKIKRQLLMIYQRLI